ncbi:TonB-dependent receptor [Sphingomonas sp. SUN039]|uniref:TonB-dependent receptor n=1 Tax=Sphingomonas sp. SUN039 TaxID=2937787 RepID=UPI00216443D3|nr:TonB-dependent receptor [Sphingomonas sp. SUN039]UVO55197.1 TonB-dependent receptor [Sphingomonas sp. SUN039]
MRKSALLASAALVAFAAPAVAEDTPPANHAETPVEIIVTAPFERDRADVLSGTSVVTGTELMRDLRPTIGDTLAHQPGVSATSFGPNASRPILRGFQGERVRVLTDGIGSIDVSNTSVDHAVVINQLTADRIEVLRGPAALLFGSSAIGGVVNVIDSRIPRKVPDEVVHIDGIASYGSASEERSASGTIDVPVAGKLVFHVDGSYAKTGNLDTGGFILSPALRAQALANPDADIRGLASLRGKLPNSAARTWDVGAGAALITDGGNLGFNVSHYDSLYGVPPRYSLDPAIETEQVRLAVQQTRVDGRAEVNIGGAFLDKIRFRGSFADYKHSEIDDTGAIGTTFLNKGWEGRLEFVQAKRGAWQGASGIQVAIRDFDVIGDEAFVPKNTTNQTGLFTLQSFDLGPFKAELGARYEHTKIQADASARLGNPAYIRSFDAFSGSLGASYALSSSLKIGLSGSHTERAPGAEELFPNGPHAGTQAFEIGNPNFRKETSNGIEATLRGEGTGYSFSLAAYHNWFDNYIYEVQTGAVQDDLPVFQFNQASATYYGFEGEASVKLAQLGDYAINLDGVGDYTRATVSGGGPVPRIPPLRLLGGLEAQSDRIDARAEVEWTADQNRVAAFETPTRGYTMVNASLAWHPLGKGNRTSVVLSASNIFNAEARRHASFLKDFAPLAGRDVRVSARFAL